jgi:hypothetical protein
MRPVLALAAALTVIASTPAAVAERQTTKPDILYKLSAVLTDKTINLRDTRLPRGTMIRYTIINQGSRTYALQIGTAKTSPIPPKGRAVIRVNWDYRGRFLYRSLYHGKPAGPHGTVTVF